ncbi:unnamed protein product [Toxocara canis]|uniref:Secreted protein n=1 Tax=Toxocara canis TaxID=6265 RepID=A0A183URF3_TOXCA|nr:unnamed protein product [Toxocara canis]
MQSFLKRTATLQRDFVVDVVVVVVVVVVCCGVGTSAYDNEDYDYAEEMPPNEQRPEDFPWHETIDEDYSNIDPKHNCTSDTGIIDKLLNGTGYNKYRLPG